jgi:hypothetical protein
MLMDEIKIYFVQPLFRITSWSFSFVSSNFQFNTAEKANIVNRSNKKGLLLVVGIGVVGKAEGFFCP